MKLPSLPTHQVKAFWKMEHGVLFGFSITAGSIIVLSIFVVAIFLAIQFQQTSHQLTASEQQRAQIQKDLTTLKNQDQFKRNETLQATISAIEKTYDESVSLYQNILDLQTQKVDVSDDLTLFINSLSFLSKRNYSSASAQLDLLKASITAEQQKLAQTSIPSAPSGGSVTTSNTPPTNGYSVQTVNTDRGSFTVSIIAADMGSTRVIVDTASDGDCSNNCPTLQLDTYVSRSGAYAGINGSFFCPADYPSCAGKTGSFDLLVMNKNKVYFNSANNVYSTNPAVIFGSGFVRFVSQASGWGRDTSVDGVLSNYPMLVSGGNIVFSGSDDPKFGSKGSRGFVANRGNTVYIGDVFNADMSDSAAVMKALSMDNAMNLDEGGSTALWYGGYKAGPGRNIPNAVLFVRK